MISDLEFSTDESLFRGALPKRQRCDQAPSLFTAIQEQLGLKLEAENGPGRFARHRNNRTTLRELTAGQNVSKTCPLWGGWLNRL